MLRRSKEGDVLQQMTATLNQTISDQMEPVVFGDAMSSANFITDQTVKNAKSKGSDSNYGKVSTMMSAVKDHITSQLPPEKVTQMFNEFVLLLYNLKLDNLAQQLVEKLRKEKPGYKSPLDEADEATSSAGVSVGVVQPYSTSMTVEELYSWLLSNYLPPEDCELFKTKSVNGMAFKYIPEAEWRSFGVSPGGLIILREHIMKQISSPSPNPANGSTSNGASSNGSSNGVRNVASSQRNGTTSSGSQMYPAATPTTVPHLPVDMVPPPQATPTRATDEAMIPASSSQVAADAGGGVEPTLLEFIKFPMRSGKVNLAQMIGTDYVNFGILLLADNNGDLTDAIVREHRGKAEDINKDIFRLWVKGTGRKPVSWATLVGVLQDMELNILARDIQQVKCHW